MVPSRLCNKCLSTNIVADRALGGKLICRNCGSHSIRSNKKRFNPRFLTGLKNRRRTVILTLILGGTFGIPIISSVVKASLPCRAYLSEALQSENMFDQNMYDKGVKNVDYRTVKQLGEQSGQGFKSKIFTMCSVNIVKDNGQSDRLLYQIATNREGQTWVRMAQFGSEADADAKLDADIKQTERDLGQ